MTATFNELRAMIDRLNPYERLFYAAKLMEQLPDLDNAAKAGACVAIAYIAGRTVHECRDAGMRYGQMAQIDEAAKQASAAARERGGH